MSARGWSAATTPGKPAQNPSTLKGFNVVNTLTLSALIPVSDSDPRVVAALQPRADTSERLRRNYSNFKLTHY